MAYDARLHTTTTKPLGISGKSTDSRSQYWSEEDGYRVYNSTSEVLSYLASTSNRKGHFPIYVNDGSGTKEYWFKDGTSNSDLVEKTSAGGETIDAVIIEDVRPVTSNAVAVAIGSIPTASDWTAKAKAISATGDQTTALNAVADDPAVLALWLEDRDITINGTVDFNGKRLKIENGKRIKGTGVLKNVYIDAPEDVQIFDSTLQVESLFNLSVSVVWFGAKADFNLSDVFGQTKTDNLPAFNKALAAATINRAELNYNYGSNIILPAPTINGYAYYISDTWKIDSAVKISGSGMYRSIIIPAHGKAAMWIPFGLEPRYGYTCEFRDFGLMGNIGGGPNGVFDGVSHGILIQSPFNKIERVAISNFRGHGIFIDGNTGTGTNAAATRVSSSRIRSNAGNGIELYGADTGLCRIEDNDFYGNGRFAIRDRGTVGGTYINNHASANGTQNTFQKSWVKYDNKGYFAVRKGAQGITGFSGITPGVTSGWADYWELFNGGAYPGDETPNYNNSETYFAGGGYASDDPNNISTWIGNYIELDQARGWCLSPSTVLGGNWAGPDVSNFIAGDIGGVISASGIKAKVIGGNGVYPALLTNKNTGILPINGFIDSDFGSGAPTGWGFLSEATLGMLRMVIDGGNDTRTHIAVRGSFLATATGRTAVPVGALLLDGVWLGVDGLSFGKARRLDFGTNAPTTGEAATGDMRLNITAGSSIIGWRCATGGTPGTWETLTLGGGGGSATSGTYTSTVANIASTSGLTVNEGYYTQIGDIVQGSIDVTLTPTATGGNSFSFTLPVASAFAHAYELKGVATSSTGLDPAFVKADVATGKATVTLAASSGVARTYAIQFTYKVTPP